MRAGVGYYKANVLCKDVNKFWMMKGDVELQRRRHGFDGLRSVPRVPELVPR